ncbi:MAG: corrinoid protein [Planctomycetes bacterium]|nr:corrinoid protein [Planctomycetota bacterium]
MPRYSQLYDAILKGDLKTAVSTTQEALAKGADPENLVAESMVPAMDEVGRRFEANEYFVPELMIAARAMKGALEILRPLLTQKGAKPTGRIVIGTVKGDLHDIGKNLVASMLEGGGFEVIDLGINVSPQQFVEAVKRTNAEMVGLSALLTTTMPSMRTIVQAFKDAGLRDRVKIMIGGAPITQEYANEIGADAFGENARTAVTLARQLMGVC